jgi:hypothetical protein
MSSDLERRATRVQPEAALAQFSYDIAPVWLSLRFGDLRALRLSPAFLSGQQAQR